VAAIVAVPLILIPFILFGGLLKPYDDMGGLSRGNEDGLCFRG
jgi:hypothetical protein